MGMCSNSLNVTLSSACASTVFLDGLDHGRTGLFSNIEYSSNSRFQFVSRLATHCGRLNVSPAAGAVMFDGTLSFNGTLSVRGCYQKGVHYSFNVKAGLAGSAKFGPSGVIVGLSRYGVGVGRR